MALLPCRFVAAAQSANSFANSFGILHIFVVQAARKLAITEVDLERAEARLEAAEA